METRASKRSQPQITVYSDDVPGQCGNYGWAARFDWTGGYVGIDQWSPRGTNTERVLLSPNQVRALLAFVEKNNRNPPRSIR